MRIKDARRPNGGPSRRGFTTLLRFNLEVAEGFLVYDLALQQAPDGRLFLYGPLAAGGAPTTSMSPTMRQEIITIALDALKDEPNDDRRAA